MKREHFLKTVLPQVFNTVQDKFCVKNKSYGHDDDLFYNFRSTALRILKPRTELALYRAMLQTLLIYVDKHLVAMSNASFDDSEFEERAVDIMVFMAIALAMYREYQQELHGMPVAVGLS